MVKRIRKPSSSQRNKEAIAIAKKLKQRGILSPQVNLHHGRYISRSVLNKVQDLQNFVSKEYKALKVPKAFAQSVKKAGYTVVRGNRIIVPNNHDFIKKVKSGAIGGVRPIPGGQMLEINMPFDVSTVADLMDKLENGDVDYLKKPNEYFTFAFFSEKTNEFHMSYGIFSNTELMRKYLERYKVGDIPFRNMKTFRIRREDISYYIPSRNQRTKQAKIRRKNRRREESEKRGYRYPTYIERMEKVRPAYANKLKYERAVRATQKREKMKADPVAYEAVKAAARLRAKKSRELAKARKGKK